MADTSDSDLSSPPSSVASSSPLSSLASTPEPPEYIAELLLPPRVHAYLPTPPASQRTSQNGSPVPSGMESGAVSDKDGPPSAKRRRISKEPKERTTEYLDLRSGDVDPDQQEELDRVMHILHKRQKIVVIAGAGMSVSAGIPDFRSSTGLFKSLKDEHKLKGSGKHLFDASVYKDDTSTSSFHSMVSSMSRLTKDAKPTAFHHMLATIAKEDRLLRLYSQNVDGIDTSLEPLKTRVPLRKDEDGKWPRTVQLHGGLDKMVCSKCHELSDFDADLFSGPTPPLCPHCEEINNIRTNFEGKRSHGIGRLRPRMVLYNEHNPDDEAIGSVTREDLRKRPDAVIVVGTTLKVPGVRRIVREMCGVVRDRRDGMAIWINNDLPPVSKDLEDCFDIVVRSNCDDVAARAAMRKWDDPIEADVFSEISDEDAQKAAAKAAWAHVPVSPRSELAHASQTVLPTVEHINNSFSPPLGSCTPKKPFDRPTWSPLTSRRSSVLPSIEPAGSVEDSITVAGGLLTPTKASRSTPAKTLLSISDRLRDDGKAKKQKSTKGVKSSTVSRKTMKPTVKYVKPAMSKPKSAAKGMAKPQSGPKKNAITSAFTQTKTASVAAKSSAKKSLPGATKSPSKLRQASNASATEPMHPLSPQDARTNMSPSKSKALFPGLQSENGIKVEKRKGVFA